MAFIVCPLPLSLFDVAVVLAAHRYSRSSLTASIPVSRPVCSYTAVHRHVSGLIHLYSLDTFDVLIMAVRQPYLCGWKIT